jgi:hypothetical protein
MARKKDQDIDLRGQDSYLSAEAKGELNERMKDKQDEVTDKQDRIADNKAKAAAKEDEEPKRGSGR